jgi:hypothetical protein
MGHKANVGEVFPFDEIDNVRCVRVEIYVLVQGCERSAIPVRVDEYTLSPGFSRRRRTKLVKRHHESEKRFLRGLSTRAIDE